MTNWFNTSLGLATLENEKLRCEQLLPAGYYPYSLQVGMPGIRFAEQIETGHSFIVDREYTALDQPSVSKTDDAEFIQAKPDVICRAGALPFAERSQNLIYLPHTLDFCHDPHEVLREVNQILVPEGCVVITGFNQLSMWGGIKLLRPKSKSKQLSPWAGHYYRVRRVQDWLSLLGFDIVGAGMLGYQPPIQSEKWREKLSFMDKSGDRWWPGLGAVYAIIGRKREMAVSGGSRGRLSWQTFLPGMNRPAAQPAARHAARSRLRLVPK